MAGIKALVIGMGVLLLAGFAVLIVTLIGSVQSGGSAEPFDVALELQPGERLAEANFDGARALFRFDGPNGGRVEVRDLKNGALLGRFDAQAPR